MIMSKSLANDALLAAVDGGQVAIFGVSVQDASTSMRWFLREYPELDIVAQISRVNGRESMTFPGGGKLSFLALPKDLNALRGWGLDRCYVPIGTRRHIVDDHIRPCLAASTDGTLAGY